MKICGWRMPNLGFEMQLMQSQSIYNRSNDGDVLLASRGLLAHGAAPL